MGENNSDTEAILLVDDNPTNLQVLYQTLEGVGCKLLIAKRGEIALSIAGNAGSQQEIIDAIKGEVDRFAGGHPADDDQALLLGVVA
jgi:two-component system sensor kinase FixL